MSRSRLRILVAGAFALALVTAACGGNGFDANESGSGDRAAAASSFEVSLKEFAIAPESINAPARSPLTFTVSNDGTTTHTFAVQTDVKVYETQEIDAGATATLSVPALDAGTYKTYCTVPGHEDLGMIGQLLVGGSGGSTMAMGSGQQTSGQMTGQMTGMTADEMAKSHKEGVDAFPAKTEGTGNQPLKPTMQNGTEVFELTATDVKWETQSDKLVDAMAFNGQIPGPQIQVEQGDHVRIVVNNQMSQPTVVHFHGMTVPNKDDGVPYITQDPIMPGGYYVYEFTVKDPPGMYVYHSHYNSV